MVEHHAVQQRILVFGEMQPSLAFYALVCYGLRSQSSNLSNFAWIKNHSMKPLLFPNQINVNERH